MGSTDGRGVHELLDELVERLQGIAGVEAIVLGGSRARGTAMTSSDIDLALYYTPAQPLDLTTLRKAAELLDDQRRTDLLTDIGGWGRWINGGGWLQAHGMPVDVLYRDLHQVGDAIVQCQAGEVMIAYQAGHPHGFLSSIYLAEVALCRVLWDPHGIVAELKARTTPYPPLLKQALINRFSWEAGFALQNARKGVAYADVAYVAGCCFRSVSCLTQTLFALNEQYWMNEKGALALAASFPHTPTRLAERAGGAFTALSSDGGDLQAAIEALSDLVQETSALLA
jgi:predicted nucleotidyltransferase